MKVVDICATRRGIKDNDVHASGKVPAAWTYFFGEHECPTKKK
jgi:hypothetical protein